MATYAIRPARETDLDAIAEMFDAFVEGHPSRDRPRPRERLRAAYFGAKPVAHLLVATRGDQVVGMVQWHLFFDAFWSMFAGRAEYLFVRPDAQRRPVGRTPRRGLCGDPARRRRVPRGDVQRRARPALRARDPRVAHARRCAVRRGFSRVRRSRGQAAARDRARAAHPGPQQGPCAPALTTRAGRPSRACRARGTSARRRW